jgi:hypothetical protein
MAATLDSQSRWTAAVYLAGGENVTREMIPSLHDLRDACIANRGDLATLAQFEPGDKAPRLFVFDDELLPGLALSSKGRGLAPTPMGLANYEHLIELSEGDATKSLALLRRFVQTARRASGDGPLLLVISGHGSGAVGELLGFRPGRDPLELRDLGRAFEQEGARKIDILGMDCCHMSMVEVACELSSHACFLVASEGSILNHGWPYREILGAVVDLSPREAAAEIARQYVGTYSDYSLLGVDSDCAVTDLERLPLLTGAMRRLAELLIAGIDDADVWRPTVLAHWEAQSYKDEEYADLGDFCDRLRLHIGDTEIRDCCSEVIEAVTRVVCTSCVSGSGSQFSTGLSVYFPWCNDAVKSKGAGGASELSSYQELAFSRETRWGDFLDVYLSATRREPRRAPATLGGSSFEGAFAPPVSTRLAEASRRVSAQSTSEVREMTMETKKTKERPSKASLKNHPRAEEPVDGSIPVRAYPPWNNRGGHSGISRLKNHPRARNA